MTNCTFTGNAAQKGSAIYNYEGTCTVTNCKFYLNTASDGDGGAIYNGGTCTVTNCTFTSNTATSGGGAIYNGGTCTVTNCTFKGNTAASGGGAIHNKGTITNISGCTFTDNTASSSGAIYNNGTITTISGCTFTGNAAVDEGDGGAIYTNGCIDYLSDCKFTGNTAYNGGAIYNKGTLNVSGCTFTDNTATNQGGVIYNIGGSCVLHFNRIVGNTANFGSAIYNNNTTSGSVDASLNWWGSNNGPNDQVVGVNVPSWLVLTINANTNIIKRNGVSTITIDLCHDNTGGYHFPDAGHVPDGMPVTFTTTLGTINNSASLVNGFAQSNLNGGIKSGYANVLVKMDSQTIQKSVTVDAAVPYVVKTYPKNKAIKISRTNKISITFNKKIGTSINWSKITVKNNKGKKIKISKTIKNNTLYIKTSKRNSNTQYTIYIPASAIKDSVGNNLTKSYTLKFKTGRK